MKNLKEIIEKLEKILLNFKKSPNRGYSAEYILAKRNTIDELKSEFSERYNQLNQTDKEICEKLIEKFKEVYQELGRFISAKTVEIKELLERSIHEEEERMINTDGDTNTTENNEMASFDITATMKIVPEFDGNPKNLTNFMNLTEFLHDSIQNPDEQKKLIKFIIRTRISEKVRNKICNESTPETFAAFQTMFRRIFKSHSNPLKIQNELTKCYQGDRTIQDFSNKVESLVAELNSIQISEQGENNRTIISKLNDQIALNAFRSGLREPFKSTIFAAQPKTLTEAVQLATEIDTDNKQTRNVLRFSGQQTRFVNYNQNQSYRSFRRGTNHNTNRNTRGNGHNNRYSGNHHNQYRGNNNWSQYNQNNGNATAYRAPATRARTGNQNRPFRRINMMNSKNIM